MKRVNKKLVVLIAAISILLIGSITVILLNSGTVVMSLKSEYASFVEKDGIITEVRFNAPANFNVIQLDSKSEVNCDKNGNEQQITIYKGSVRKSFFESKPTVTIDSSHVYQFVFTDRTVTITNGVLTDSIQK